MFISYSTMLIVCFQCLLVGDSEGQVTVLQLRSMPEPPTPEKQVYHVLILNKFIGSAVAQW